MNCKDFESSVLGLDSGEFPGGAALDHAASCPGCQNKLEAVQDLRGALAALARHDAAMEAPAELEAAMLQKLAQNRQDFGAQVVATRSPATPRFRFIVAAAAALILVAIAAGIELVRSKHMRSNLNNSVISNGHEIQSASPEPGARGDQRKDSMVVNPRVLPRRDQADRQHSTGGQQVATERDRESNKPPRGGSRRGTARPDRTEEFEIATDYFPINFGSFMQPIDGGQIVRIKLPRSALRSYGLPVDPLRADEAVKADVVIGNDGMARAIRFVH